MNLPLRPALVILALTSSAIASAEVVFSNFGPGDSYNTSLGWILGDGLFTDMNQYVAARFTPTTTVRFDSADLALMSRANITIELRQNSGSMPGAVIETFTASVWSDGIYSVSSTLNPILSAGQTYWMFLKNDIGIAGWFQNTQGMTGMYTQSLINPPTWHSDLISPAFRINGSAVPAPAALLPFAAAALGLRRRRR